MQKFFGFSFLWYSPSCSCCVGVKSRSKSTDAQETSEDMTIPLHMSAIHLPLPSPATDAAREFSSDDIRSMGFGEDFQLFD